MFRALALLILMVPSLAHGMDWCGWLRRAAASVVRGAEPVLRPSESPQSAEYTSAEHDPETGIFTIRSESRKGEVTVTTATPIFWEAGPLSHYEFRSQTKDEAGRVVYAREWTGEQVPITLERVWSENRWRNRSQREIEVHAERRKNLLEVYDTLHGLIPADVERARQVIVARRPDLDPETQESLADALAIIRGPRVKETLAFVVENHSDYRGDPAKLRAALCGAGPIRVSIVGMENWRFSDLVVSRLNLLKYGFDPYVKAAWDQ